VRRLRHEHGWSPRDLVDAIGCASERATGVRETITPNLLRGIEEKSEKIPYATLCLVADGLDCDPSDISSSEPEPTSIVQ
jgi:transcriptional regulator with XRE-family HTH domain